MTTKDKQRPINDSSTEYLHKSQKPCSSKLIPHYRLNPVTGERDWFAPQEIKEPIDEELARLHGFEIGWTKYGYRTIRAAMVPCKLVARDANGVEHFIDTPSEIQHQRYCAFMGDEWKEQDAEKQAGRCQIPNGRGGVKRCPTRIPNPAYIPGSDEPKTLPVRCESCPFLKYRQFHVSVPFSEMSSEDNTEDDDGYEVPSPENYREGERFEKMRKLYADYVRTNLPNSIELAEILIDEFSLSEAARMLGKPRTTLTGHRTKLLHAAHEFIDSTLIV